MTDARGMQQQRKKCEQCGLGQTSSYERTQSWIMDLDLCKCPMTDARGSWREVWIVRDPITDTNRVHVTKPEWKSIPLGFERTQFVELAALREAEAQRDRYKLALQKIEIPNCELQQGKKPYEIAREALGGGT